MIASSKGRPRVLGAAIMAARSAGLIVLLLAIGSIPQVRSLCGRFAADIGILSSVILGLAGLVWLALVELFLRFFDQYLSRN